MGKQSHVRFGSNAWVRSVWATACMLRLIHLVVENYRMLCCVGRRSSDVYIRYIKKEIEFRR